MLIFGEGGKPEKRTRRKTLETEKRTDTNSTHFWCLVRGSNPGHIGGRRVLSPLRHPCFPCCFYKKVKPWSQDWLIAMGFGNVFVTGQISVQNHSKIFSGVLRTEFSSHKGKVRSNLECICLLPNTVILFLLGFNNIYLIYLFNQL